MFTVCFWTIFVHNRIFIFSKQTFNESLEFCNGQGTTLELHVITSFKFAPLAARVHTYWSGFPFKQNR